jgi:hypothetical protein
VAFGGLFPFLTRNALRAIQKPQAIHKTTKPRACAWLALACWSL